MSVFQGLIADDITYSQVAKLAQAAAAWWLDQRVKRVVVGYDSRFLSERFAAKAAQILMANGLEVQVAKSHLPQPAFGFAVSHQEAGGGLYVGGGKQPAEYSGVSLWGAQQPLAPQTITALDLALDQAVPKQPAQPAQAPIFDVRKPYLESLTKQLNLEALQAAEGVVYHESMGGATGGWMGAFFKQAKLKFELRELHAVPHPLFYGVTPEITPLNLRNLFTLLSNEPSEVIALINDGDGSGAGWIRGGGKAADLQILPSTDGMLAALKTLEAQALAAKF